jgi:large subunit ribosomal protein L35
MVTGMPNRRASDGQLLEGTGKMPKMKTKSGAKKRFKLTGKGKVVMYPSQRRHRQHSRPKKMKRQARGPEIINDSDARVIKKIYLPYGL